MRTKFELADVVHKFGAALLAKGKLTPLQLKVLGKIADCRTAALGGQEEACENCGTVRYSHMDDHHRATAALKGPTCAILYCKQS